MSVSLRTLFRRAAAAAVLVTLLAVPYVQAAPAAATEHPRQGAADVLLDWFGQLQQRLGAALGLGSAVSAEPDADPANPVQVAPADDPLNSCTPSCDGDSGPIWDPDG